MGDHNSRESGPERPSAVIRNCPSEAEAFPVWPRAGLGTRPLGDVVCTDGGRRGSARPEREPSPGAFMRNKANLRRARAIVSAFWENGYDGCKPSHRLGKTKPISWADSGVRDLESATVCRPLPGRVPWGRIPLRGTAKRCKSGSRSRWPALACPGSADGSTVIDNGGLDYEKDVHLLHCGPSFGGAVRAWLGGGGPVRCCHDGRRVRHCPVGRGGCRLLSQ